MATLEEIMALRAPNNSGVDPRAILTSMANVGPLPQASLFGMGVQDAKQASAALDDRMKTNLALIRGAQQDAIAMDKNSFEAAMKAHSAYMSEKANELKQQELALDRAYKMGSLAIQRGHLGLAQKELDYKEKKLAQDAEAARALAEYRQSQMDKTKAEIEEKKAKLEQIDNLKKLKVTGLLPSGDKVETDAWTWLAANPRGIGSNNVTAKNPTEQRLLNLAEQNSKNLGLSPTDAYTYAYAVDKGLFNNLGKGSIDIQKGAEDTDNPINSRNEAIGFKIDSILSTLPLSEEGKEIIKGILLQGMTGVGKKTPTTSNSLTEPASTSKPEPAQSKPKQTSSLQRSEEDYVRIANLLAERFAGAYPKKKVE